MKLYDLQAKAGPPPGNFKCSQSYCIQVSHLSIKMYSQPTFELQVFILLVPVIRSSVWHTQRVSFRDVKHCAHLGICYVTPQEQSCSPQFTGHIWKDWLWSAIFKLRTYVFLTMKTRPILNRLRIKGASARLLFRESARWKTLAALPRKVHCSLPQSITPHLSRAVLRLLIPPSHWKHSSCAGIFLPSICQ